MIPRGRLATLLFAALLLFAQSGALLHVTAHHPPGAGHAHQEDPAHPENPAACELCLAYTPLVSGAAASSASLPVVSMTPPPPARVLSPLGDADRHAYLSRAPPAALR